MLLKPLADGLIVDLQHTPGKDDREEHHTCIYRDVHPYRRRLVLLEPAHLHIHKRIMRDIQRIGKVSQPLANGGALLVGGNGTGTSKYDNREYEQDTYSLIDAVRNAGLSADAGNAEEDDKRQATPPETALQMDGRAAGIAFTSVRRKNAGNEEAAEERIEQTGKADVQLLPVLNKVLILLKRLFIFIFGCAGSSLLCWLFFSCEWGLLGCHTQDSHHSGFSCCRTQALEHTAFSSCSIWAP